MSQLLQGSYARVSVKPGTAPEHPQNTPGTSHNTPEHPIMPQNTLNTARNTLEHQK